MRMRRARRLAGLALGLTVLAACGGGGGAGDVPSTPAHTPVPLPTKTLVTIEDRCSLPVQGRLTRFPGPEGASLSGAVLGDGPVAAVLLHQTSSGGMCGFVPYAAWLAEQGVRAVLVDFCNWGASECPPAMALDWEAQVRIPIEWARSQGATRVTVVGASLGGIVGLGVGQRAGADAIVNLSGPDTWEGGLDAGRAAAETTVPLLVAASDSDRGIDTDALRAAVDASPAVSKRYVDVAAGHGWSMLNDGSLTEPAWTPLARTVLGWVKAR